MSDDLEKFVRARLDEDEHTADEIHSTWNCATAGPIPYSCDCGVPDRLRREVAAKRRLLDTADQAYYAADHYAYDQIRSALAAVWSDHPEYRQEWA